MEIELGCCQIKNTVLLAKLKLPTCIFVSTAIPATLPLKETRPKTINYKKVQTLILGKVYRIRYNVNSGGNGGGGALSLEEVKQSLLPGEITGF